MKFLKNFENFEKNSKNWKFWNNFLFEAVSALQLPGGNQVDGLPPAHNKENDS